MHVFILSDWPLQKSAILHLSVFMMFAPSNEIFTIYLFSIDNNMFQKQLVALLRQLTSNQNEHDSIL